MLNRRQLRVKVVQAIYAYELSENEQLEVGEKELFKSLNDIERLFVCQLSLLLEVADFAALRMEDAKSKFFPTEEEKNPSTRFIDNRVLQKIRQNITMQSRIKAYKISWTEYQEMIRKLYNNLKVSDIYKDYLYAEKDSFGTDKTFLEKMYYQFYVENEDIESFYEEQNIHWASDYDIVNNMILRYVKGIKADQGENAYFPQVFRIDNVDGVSEDKVFVKDLFRKCVINKDKHIQLIAERATNWEFDRIATMDKLLLRMAVTELMLFPSIPVKVTLNEYIELSKIFSTPRSRIFINGVLDKMIEQLRADKKIVKTGRGLMEN